VNPADEARLRATIDKAIEVADAILKKNPKDTQALYAKGVANATLASFEGTVKRSYMAAGRRAKAARNLHKEVLAIDPSFHDAELSIGMYNYVVGIVPGIARYTILMVLGLSSEGKEVGIRQVETAAAKGKRASIDAKMMLIVVYNREQRYEESLKLLDELHRKYPRNFVFEVSKANVYTRMKMWDQAAEVYRRVTAKNQQRVDGYERIRIERIYSEMGNSQIHASKFGEAGATFTKLIGSANATPNEKANAHLWLGKMADTSNNRAEALKHYKAVLALDCEPHMKEEARKYERRPFK
jgi:tetratricopeptide (TPR) repeat protein